jgi:hypothetical protein
MSDLEARLSRLETSNRRWKIGAVALLLVVGVAGADFAVNVGVFDTIKCKRIQIDGTAISVVDSKGDMVASLDAVGGLACRKLYVITPNLKTGCSIEATLDKDGFYAGSIFLHDSDNLSVFDAGKPVSHVRKPRNGR